MSNIAEMRRTLVKAVWANDDLSLRQRRRFTLTLWFATQETLEDAKKAIVQLAIAEEVLSPDEALSDIDWDKVFEWLVRIIELIMSFI